MLLPYMYEWCMNYVYMARPPKIVIVLSVLPNWNKTVNQSINQSMSKCVLTTCSPTGFWQGMPDHTGNSDTNITNCSNIDILWMDSDSESSLQGGYSDGEMFSLSEFLGSAWGSLGFTYTLSYAHIHIHIHTPIHTHTHTLIHIHTYTHI